MGLIIAGGSPSRGGRTLALPGTYCQPSLGQVCREGRVYTLKAITNPPPLPMCLHLSIEMLVTCVPRQRLPRKNQVALAHAPNREHYHANTSLRASLHNT